MCTSQKMREQVKLGPCAQLRRQRWSTEDSTEAVHEQNTMRTRLYCEGEVRGVT